MTLYGVAIFTPTILAAFSLVGRGFRLDGYRVIGRTAVLDVFLLLGFGLNLAAPTPRTHLPG